MKNLKRFVVVFMTAALFSTSFTSCIDNDVDPAVMSIYRSQADLIAAQVALLEAEAALLEAQAAHELAIADLVAAQIAREEAITAGIEADNAHEALVRMQELMVIEAETAAEVAMLENEMALAQQQFENDMAALLAELAEAGAEIAAGYAADYAMTMDKIADLKLTKIQKQDYVADKELYLELMALGIANAQTALEGIIAEKDAMIAANNAMIAAYQAILEDPSTLAGQVDALNAMIDELEADCDDYNLQIVELENQIAALYDEWYANDDLIEEYEDKLDFHDDLVDMRDALIDANEGLQDNIDMYTQALADYDGVKAGLETDVADAAQAVADAWMALGLLDGNGDEVAWDGYFMVDADGDPIAAGGVKYGTPANLKEELVNAEIDKMDAAADEADALTALNDLIAVINGLEASLNAAAADLATEQGIFDAGIGAATAAVTTATNNVALAEAALLLAQNNYEAWKTVFEANPNGYTWYDDTNPSVVLGDDLLGLQDEDSNVPTETFVQVLTWTWVDDNLSGVADAGDTYLPATLDVGNSVLSIDGASDEYEILGNDAVAWADIDAGVNTYFVEIGLDDSFYVNLTEFQAATTALGNEDIFDNPPMFGDVASGDTGAWADLWNAQLALINAQDALDNFGVALADAQEDYDELKAVYENELTLLDAAQLAYSDAQDAHTAASDAYDDAKDAVDAAAVELGQDFPEGEAGDTPRVPGDAVPTDSLTLNEQEWNAEIALADFCETTKEDIQDMIDDWMAQMAENDLYIAEYQIGIDKAFEEVSELQDAYDDLMNTPLNAQLLVDIYELYDQIWAIEDMKDADEAAIDAMENTIGALEAYGSYMSNDYIEDVIEDLMDDNMYLEADKEQAVEDLGLTEEDQLSDAEEMEMIQRWIDLANETIEAIDAEIAALEALAAEYKALMEAALSS